LSPTLLFSLFLLHVLLPLQRPYELSPILILLSMDSTGSEEKTQKSWLHIMLDNMDDESGRVQEELDH
jgi:hypothetical protein